MMRLFIKITFLSIIFFSCQPKSEIIEPPIDMSKFVIQDDFQIEVIASEPLIEAPVAMTFDNQGRIWVMEMPDYMPNIHGSDEGVPRGRIVILEDKNENGRMDNAKVFLEKLSQPRAMALVYGGLLYAESPNLWFVEIEDDKPVNKVLVDSLYAVGGNVEHQPNGLEMNLDNWIYNAKCNYRYRRINGEWRKESTHFRGQWGMTHDDYGRLFYNDNSNYLYGDVVMPNLMTRNKYLHPKEGVGKNICSDRKIYPLHVTSVNRGYQDGMLDENKKLRVATSVCSPMIYRGGKFGDDYQGNAFVCAPEANALKRIILHEKDLEISGKHAWDDREFLASTDEGFRPVNLDNAPDGSMYVTDMHRGIIQHKVYMTAYLKKQIEEKQLDTIYNAGRILRIFKKENQKQNFDLDKMSNEELCDVLKNKNGWFRDRAQQILIHRNAKDVVSKLEEMTRDNSNHLAQLHALWTLEGLNALDVNVLLSINKNVHPKVISFVVRFLGEEKLKERFEEFFQIKNKGIDIHLALSVSQHRNVEKSFSPASSAGRFLKKIKNRYVDDSFVAEAIISGLEGKEESFFDYVENDSNGILQKKLKDVIENKKNNKVNSIFTRIEQWRDDKDFGRDLFNVHCAACHGIGGEGIANLAPSLLDADLVEEDSELMARIILHGLEGEIHVNGKLEKYDAAMPGLKDNAELTDKDIAAITHYVKNAFSMNPEGIKIEKVTELRNQLPQNGNFFTEKELLGKLDEK